MKRIYLAGPMTGLPEKNFPAFAAETARLRALGYHVESPAEIAAELEKRSPAASWADYMRADIPALLTCDWIVVLPGWETSRGAGLELQIARALDMAVLFSGGAASGRCPHSVLLPHECRECSDETPQGEIARWMEEELASRQHG